MATGSADAGWGGVEPSWVATLLLGGMVMLLAYAILRPTGTEDAQQPLEEEGGSNQMLDERAKARESKAAAKKKASEERAQARERVRQERVAAEAAAAAEAAQATAAAEAAAAQDGAGNGTGHKDGADLSELDLSPEGLLVYLKASGFYRLRL
jgi:hypothetical protein